MKTSRLMWCLALAAVLPHLGCGATRGPDRPTEGDEAETGNACRLVVSLERDEFRQHEPIPIVCRYENSSGKDLTLWSCGLANHLVLVNEDMGQEPEMTRQGKLARASYMHPEIRDGNTPVVLKAGRVMDFQRVDLTSLYRIKPGRYHLVVVYDQGAEGSRLTFASSPTAFRVTE